MSVEHGAQESVVTYRVKNPAWRTLYPAHTHAGRVVFAADGDGTRCSWSVAVRPQRMGRWLVRLLTEAIVPSFAARLCELVGGGSTWGFAWRCGEANVEAGMEAPASIEPTEAAPSDAETTGTAIGGIIKVLGERSRSGAALSGAEAEDFRRDVAALLADARSRVKE